MQMHNSGHVRGPVSPNVLPERKCGARRMLRPPGGGVGRPSALTCNARAAASACPGPPALGRRLHTRLHSPDDAARRRRAVASGPGDPSPDRTGGGRLDDDEHRGAARRGHGHPAVAGRGTAPRRAPGSRRRPGGPGVRLRGPRRHRAGRRGRAGLARAAAQGRRRRVRSRCGLLRVRGARHTSRGGRAHAGRPRADGAGDRRPARRLRRADAAHRAAAGRGRARGGGPLLGPAGDLVRRGARRDPVRHPARDGHPAAGHGPAA